GGAHAVRLDQEEGAVPVRVIFEPALPGRRLLAASVDSQPAELDARPFLGRVRVPLQVVLDHVRSIDLDVEWSAAHRPITGFGWRSHLMNRVRPTCDYTD